jgi:hypothetical protein
VATVAVAAPLIVTEAVVTVNVAEAVIPALSVSVTVAAPPAAVDGSVTVAPLVPPLGTAFKVPSDWIVVVPPTAKVVVVPAESLNFTDATLAAGVNPTAVIVIYVDVGPLLGVRMMAEAGSTVNDSVAAGLTPSETERVEVTALAGTRKSQEDPLSQLVVVSCPFGRLFTVVAVVMGVTPWSMTVTALPPSVTVSDLLAPKPSPLRVT